jgi:hypothetical protein
MGKESELLQAVRDLNMPVLYKLLGKNRASKTSEYRVQRSPTCDGSSAAAAMHFSTH